MLEDDEVYITEPDIPAQRTTAVGHFSFLDELPLAAEAFEFMAERHAGQVRKADSAPFLLHPLEAGALLHVFGYPERVIAGLLHDILESSDTTAVELRMRVGSLIAGLVETVSENPAVQDAVERKARLRRQVARSSSGSGPTTALGSALS